MKQTLFAAMLAAAVPAHATDFNALHSFDFNTADQSEGWEPAGAAISVSDGSATGTATINDPQLRHDDFNFLGNASSGVLLRYRGSHQGNAQLFWGTSVDDFYSASRAVTLHYPGGSEWRTLFLLAKGHPEWDDQTITRLRFDPPGSFGSTFEIDWVRVLSWDYDNDGWPDHIEGTGDTDGDGLLDMEDPYSSGDRIPDAWKRAIANAPGSVHFDFDTDAQAEGWAASGDFTLQGVSSGHLVGEVSGSDPHLVRGRLHLQAALIDGLILRVQTPSPGNITLFWTHDGGGAGSFSQIRSIRLQVPASPDAACSVYFDLRQAPEWKGKVITSLRIDPDFPLGTVFSIDAIHTSDGDYDRDGIVDSAEGVEDRDGDGLAHFEDVDSDGDGVSDAEETRLGWDPYDPAEATRDSDGDGVPDAAEVIAGTDPYSPDDFPVLEIRSTDGDYDLATQARPGRSYRLERSDNLGAWDPGQIVPEVEGSPELIWQVVAPTEKPQEFFRLRVNGPLEMPNPLHGGESMVAIGGSETAYLDNGVLRMGAPTGQGASINFLAPSGGTNLVNWHDPGRLIQQSYYAGPTLDRTAEGQSTNWSPWPWNPIQGGDASNAKSQVIEMTQFDSGIGFFTRTVPLLWDMKTGEKAEAWMDQWNQFEPGMPEVIRVTCRFISFRNPADPWSTSQPRHQELPAVYLIRSLSKVVTYQGENPWTHDDLEVSSITPGPPWIQHNPTEDWAAMVDPNTDVGLGLYSPFGDLFWWIGAHRVPPGGPTDPQTMHMAPLRSLQLGRDSILVYRYWLIYGDLSTIRERIYQLRERYPHG